MILPHPGCELSPLEADGSPVEPYRSGLVPPQTGCIWGLEQKQVSGMIDEVQRGRGQQTASRGRASRPGSIGMLACPTVEAANIHESGLCAPPAGAPSEVQHVVM